MRATGRKKHARRRHNARGAFRIGCVPQEVGPIILVAWSGLQITCLLFLWALWGDVSSHLDLFSQTLAEQCAPAHLRHDICLGPMWNLSFWNETVLKGPTSSAKRCTVHRKWQHEGHWREPNDPNDCLVEQGDSYTFEFHTRSVPPTFLVGVVPLAVEDKTTALVRHPWTISITRTDPPQIDWFNQSHTEMAAMTFEDLSSAAKEASSSEKPVTWKAIIHNRGSPKRKSLFRVFVEDTTMQHLEQIRSSSRCSFVGSWRAFNKESQGQGHGILWFCRYALGILLCAGACATYLVISSHWWLMRRGMAEDDKSEEKEKVPRQKHVFHRVVLGKAIFVDAPLQICMVLYILGWYEADALNCQLCLFHPLHCKDESPYTTSVVAVVVCSFMSSLSHQLLLRPYYARSGGEEDVTVSPCLRILACCISTLPLTSGIACASSSLLWSPQLLHVFVFAPCFIGWLSGLLSLLTLMAAWVDSMAC
eukprot:TRINITY_DN69594_c0_g1_i1.p1 TRINITY_DN69594_c0_g1~~TRINITY_DN69594_c0_g1_i1.p1  ORF type:complete len:478 (+),score=33.75 TRINITY_DN69594_c0_g1_i1:53-1486(+)